jgi:hypothetical protein
LNALTASKVWPTLPPIEAIWVNLSSKCLRLWSMAGLSTILEQELRAMWSQLESVLILTTFVALVMIAMTAKAEIHSYYQLINKKIFNNLLIK